MQKSVHIRLMFPAAGSRGGMEDGRREEMRRVIEKSFFPGFSFCYFPCELLLLSGALLFLAFCFLSATLLLFFLLVLSMSCFSVRHCLLIGVLAVRHCGGRLLGFSALYK